MNKMMMMMMAMTITKDILTRKMKQIKQNYILFTSCEKGSSLLFIDE